METRLINEQSLMIYFENEISENTYEKVNKTVQYIQNQKHKDIIDIVFYTGIALIFVPHLLQPIPVFWKCVFVISII